MKHPVDVHVGKRIRHRRWMVGMTQQQLGDKVGIKFQQIQKYETGMNRVSASRLWDIAAALEVPINFFFEGVDENATDQLLCHSRTAAQTLVRFGSRFERRRLTKKCDRGHAGPSSGRLKR